MFTTKQKLELCGVKYYLDDFPELFDYEEYKVRIIDPHLKKLPLLNEYAEHLFDYGKHSYCEKRQIPIGHKDFIYCYNLVKEYKLLLDDDIVPKISIPGSDNSQKRKEKKDHITHENYKKILMYGLEEEMKRYNLNRIAKSVEEISCDFNEKETVEWLRQKLLVIEGKYWDYPKEKIAEKLVYDHIVEYTHAFDFTPDYISFLMKRMEELDEEYKLIKAERGRPSATLERECIERLYLLLTIDARIAEINGFKDLLKKSSIIVDDVIFAFIYDFLKYFHVYDTNVDENNTTTKSDLIKALFNSKKHVSSEGFCYESAIKSIYAAILCTKAKMR
ncbi:hypothetical protein D0T49_07375 [Paludibacter sp. 221]|uniref:hypothetical protein n=1 Tax=Paludibacter sp. 221 TaxID=2302939 RepID=UPI0013CFCA07|nr:hypothetical protein [Paludibacter sp. 221]NDV46867.1 hypothetical protein [Paludibacter sp. 221]